MKDNYIGVEEAAKLLKLAKGTVYQKVHSRTIPHYKVGGRLYFDKEELLSMIRGGRVDVKEETLQA